MSKDMIKVEGIIVDVLANRQFKVQLENGVIVLAYASGKIVSRGIRLLMNDSVVVELSPYDLTKGRIVFRKKDNQSDTKTRVRS